MAFLGLDLLQRSAALWASVVPFTPVARHCDAAGCRQGESDARCRRARSPTLNIPIRPIISSDEAAEALMSPPLAIHLRTAANKNKTEQAQYWADIDFECDRTAKTGGPPPTNARQKPRLLDTCAGKTHEEGARGERSNGSHRCASRHFPRAPRSKRPINKGK